MKTLRIKNLIFTPKAIGLIAIAFFCFGILLGANIALSVDTGKNFNIPYMILFSIPIWLILYRSIKREIIVVDTQNTSDRKENYKHQGW